METDYGGALTCRGRSVTALGVIFDCELIKCQLRKQADLLSSSARQVRAFLQDNVLADAQERDNPVAQASGAGAVVQGRDTR